MKKQVSRLASSVQSKQNLLLAVHYNKGKLVDYIVYIPSPSSLGMGRLCKGCVTCDQS